MLMQEKEKIRNLALAALILSSMIPILVDEPASAAAPKQRVKKQSPWNLAKGRFRARLNALKNVEVIDTEIPVRDGRSLSAYIWLPKNRSQKMSTIYSHTPYTKFGSLAALLGRKDTANRDKFAYVITDWRGFFGSKPAARGVKKIEHGKDGYDVIEWIAKQPWSNGKVGMLGHSALGGIQYPIAIEKPPHLICAVPSSGNLGHPYETYYYGGVAKKHYLDSLNLLGFNKAGGVLVTGLVKTKNKLWDMAEKVHDPARIDLPMLFFTSWFDTHPAPKLNSFRKIRTPDKKNYQNMKLVIGPWHHNGFNKSKQGDLNFPEASKIYEKEIQDFFEQFLLGEDKNWSKRPPVRYFDMGSRKWLTSESFPPSTLSTPLFLSNDKKLVKLFQRNKEVTAGGKTFNTFPSDPLNPSPTVGGCNLDASDWNIKILKKTSISAGPRDQKKVEDREDCLKFTSPVLKEDLEVVGVPIIELYCSSTADDTDFAVRLTDVYPDGKSILVSDGIKRLAFRHSLRHPKRARPNEVYELKVELVPTAITFKKGHRIRIDITSSNFPRFELNPNEYRYGLSALKKGPLKKAVNKVYHGAGYPSKLILPTASH